MFGLVFGLVVVAVEKLNISRNSFNYTIILTSRGTPLRSPSMYVRCLSVWMNAATKTKFLCFFMKVAGQAEDSILQVGHLTL